MTLLSALLLIVISFVPSLLYLIWFRNSEKYNREKWKPIFLCFLWGATIAIIGSFILEVILSIPIALTSNNYTIYIFIGAVVIAPFAEELTKPLALRLKSVKKELDELEDGLIYGAVAGLGFAATENLLYGYDALISEGIIYFFIIISIRSFAGCLLHASATAWTGYGYGKVIMKKSKIISIIPYFLIAMFIHGFYNFLPAYGMITGLTVLMVFAFIFVGFSFYIVRKKIKNLDALNNENIL